MDCAIGIKTIIQKNEIEERAVTMSLKDDNKILMLKIVSKDNDWQYCVFNKEEADEFIDNFVNMTGFMEDENN